MALRFTPPNTPVAKTPEAALLEPVGQAVQNLPHTILAWQQFKQQKMQHDIQMEELRQKMELLKRETQGKYGTGEPAPMQAGTITPTVPQVGPEEQMFGFEATPPSAIKETPEQQFQRLGAEAYKTLNPPEYVASGIGPDGRPVFTTLPKGTKPAPPLPSPTPILSATGEQIGTTIGKPTVLPSPDKTLSRESAKAKSALAEARPMVESSIAEIDRVRELNKNAYGGFFGNLVRKGKSAMNSGDNDDKFKNTTDVINTMQGMVAKVLKSTFGGQLSDSEREYLNGVYGALPSLSQTERDIAMQNVRKMLAEKLAAAEGRVSEMGGEIPQIQPKTQAIHNAALEWADANPNDPRAAAVRQKAFQAAGDNNGL